MTGFAEMAICERTSGVGFRTLLIFLTDSCKPEKASKPRRLTRNLLATLRCVGGKRGKSEFWQMGCRAECKAPVIWPTEDEGLKVGWALLAVACPVVQIGGQHLDTLSPSNAEKTHPLSQGRSSGTMCPVGRSGCVHRAKP